MKLNRYKHYYCIYIVNNLHACEHAPHIVYGYLAIEILAHVISPGLIK